jgi:hypothetical protein
MVKFENSHYNNKKPVKPIISRNKNMLEVIKEYSIEETVNLNRKESSFFRDVSKLSSLSVNRAPSPNSLNSPIKFTQPDFHSR